MRLLFILILSTVLWSCQSESATTEESTTTASTSTVSEQESAPPTPPAEGPVVQRTGAGREVPVNNDDYIDLKLVGGKVTKGERICLNVYANHFQDVMSMQYTIQWDPAVLELAAIGKFQLEDLSTNNFGAHKANEGILTFSWYDNDLQGVSAPDGVSIYQVCYVGIGEVGSSSTVEFTNSPVPFEISNKAGEIIRFEHEGGSVSITE